MHLLTTSVLKRNVDPDLFSLSLEELGCHVRLGNYKKDVQIHCFAHLPLPMKKAVAASDPASPGR